MAMDSRGRYEASDPLEELNRREHDLGAAVGRGLGYPTFGGHTPRPAQVVGFAPYERRVMELIRNSKVSVLNTRGHAQGGPRH